MSDLISDLARRLVVGHKRDRRSIYDEQAKRELILACREPGASIAKLARDCGVNANQVNSWVRLYERQLAESVAPSVGDVIEAKAPAFVALDIAAVCQEELRHRRPNPVGRPWRAPVRYRYPACAKSWALWLGPWFGSDFGPCRARGGADVHLVCPPAAGSRFDLRK